jgi:polyhydroxyalkanoate synthesis regulator phasin
MSSKKKLVAIAVTITALTAGSVGIASAHDKGAGRGKVMSELVSAGTITQTQANAITKDATRAADKAVRAAHRAAVESTITLTIGLDATTIKNRLAAGESLATIAGEKKDALITALVALKTTHIDGYVEAGKLTAAQATTHKANLTSRITELVNAVGGKGLGHKGMGEKMGKGLRR